MSASRFDKYAPADVYVLQVALESIQASHVYKDLTKLEDVWDRVIENRGGTELIAIIDELNNQ